jgi:hypothetical protein
MISAKARASSARVPGILRGKRAKRASRVLRSPGSDPAFQPLSLAGWRVKA